MLAVQDADHDRTVAVETRVAQQERVTAGGVELVLVDPGSVLRIASITPAPRAATQATVPISRGLLTLRISSRSGSGPRSWRAGGALAAAPRSGSRAQPPLPRSHWRRRVGHLQLVAALGVAFRRRALGVDRRGLAPAAQRTSIASVNSTVSAPVGAFTTPRPRPRAACPPSARAARCAAGGRATLRSRPSSLRYACGVSILEVVDRVDPRKARSRSSSGTPWTTATASAPIFSTRPPSALNSSGGKSDW